jgi:magnesium transporter
MPTRKRKATATRHGETAGHYLIAGVPRARPQQTAGEVIEQLLARRHDNVDILCITDADDKLRGILGIAELLGMPRDGKVGESMRADCPRVHPDVDQERVASLALHHALNTIPVVDRSERLLGIVPTEALLHILRREHVEDIHRFAGITRETHRAREAIESPPLRRARHRLPWLVLGLLGSMVATFVVSRFEQALTSNISIGFFVPGLVYLADAIGTQTEAVAVRGLSLSHTRLARLVGGELRTGVLIGLVLGAITLPSISLVFGDLRLALAVTFALFCAGAVATTVGLILPWLLSRLGSDPAYGSGPLATIIQDVLSLVIYFTIVSAVVL